MSWGPMRAGLTAATLTPRGTCRPLMALDGHSVGQSWTSLVAIAFLSSGMTILFLVLAGSLGVNHAPSHVFAKLQAPDCPTCPACQAAGAPPSAPAAGAADAAAPVPWNGNYFEPKLPPCPNSCNNAKGWGTCKAVRCICAVGRGGADCAFSLNALYGDLFDYKAFASSTQMRPLDLQGWSPGADVYHKYMALADTVTAIEAGTWKGLSASHLAEWLKGQGRGLLVTVDTWLGSAEPFYWELNSDKKNLDRHFGYPTVRAASCSTAAEAVPSRVWLAR